MGLITDNPITGEGAGAFILPYSSVFSQKLRLGWGYQFPGTVCSLCMQKKLGLMQPEGSPLTKRCRCWLLGMKALQD